MKKMTAIALGISLALGVSSCSNNSPSSETSQNGSALGSGIDLSSMDTSVAPQQDFFRYVNGKWLENTQIPADKARWGSFDALAENAENDVRAMIQSLAATEQPAGSDEQKIADLYKSFMDEVLIEQLGLSPLKPYLARIDQLKNHADLALLWGEWQPYGTGTPIELYIDQDDKNSEQYITGAYQSGLGLPDREYYLKTDAQSVELRGKYQKYIEQLFTLAGEKNPTQAAANVVALEKKIAAIHWTRVQNRDRTATYNKMTLAELNKAAPGLNWNRFFDAAQLGNIDAVVVNQPTYVKAFAQLQAKIPLAHWQQYLTFHVLNNDAGNLNKAFVDANFDFYGKTLSGIQEQRPREKRAAKLADTQLGFLVGKKYVEQQFKPEAKARMDLMIENLRKAYSQSIEELTWMSPETKRQAQTKLAKFNTKIGYPEKWRDYNCVTINAKELVANLRRNAICEQERAIARLGKPVDRTEWAMTPQTVNAYYNPSMNEIVFPAAILQPPFFNVAADDAVNYGAIGAVIGHEFTHGFDDQGRHSDGDGNLRDWWTEEDAAQFKSRAQLMVDQYSAYNPIDDLHLQGALGLGENIADLGGVTLAHRAYKNSLGGKPGKTIDGFTAEQRFFMGWAQVWRIKYRDEALRRQVINGPHSPGEYRVLGPLSNMTEFYEVYGVKPGDGMYRDEKVRVKIW
ncbi:M13 family metallopeptidase [Cellvibrio sp. pealriver]|uniref:M13 family metallopeptidase n=1 Tax=Cellvibrio sp. pealriver TaxID=1622269 RepID=UPI00066FE306|nr:M13 family metallopeptidase [Cellvibrio sp. pealriver]